MYPIYIEFIKILLSKKIILDEKNYDGETILDYAVKNKKDKVIQLFVDNGIDMSHYFPNPLISLITAPDLSKHKKTILTMINTGTNLDIKSNTNETLLELSTRDVELFDLLIKKGINVNEPFRDGKSPIENIMRWIPISPMKIRMVGLLINAGAKVDSSLLTNELIK